MDWIVHFVDDWLADTHNLHYDIICDIVEDSWEIFAPWDNNYYLRYKDKRFS